MDTEAALAEGTDGEEDGHDDFLGRKGVDGQSVEVQCQDAGGETLADAPEDIGRNEGREGVSVVREGLGDYTTRGGGDDCRDNGEE